MGQKYLFELRRCSSYGGSSNRELLMRIYQEIFTLPEESFELRRGSRKSSQRESTVLTIYLYKGIIFRSSPPYLSFKNLFCKCAANLQEEINTEVRFQKSCVALLHGCSAINLLQIYRTPFQKNTSGGLLLCFVSFILVQIISNTI